MAGKHIIRYISLFQQKMSSVMNLSCMHAKRYHLCHTTCDTAHIAHDTPYVRISSERSAWQAGWSVKCLTAIWYANLRCSPNTRACKSISLYYPARFIQLVALSCRSSYFVRQSVQQDYIFCEQTTDLVIWTKASKHLCRKMSSWLLLSIWCPFG